MQHLAIPVQCRAIGLTAMNPRTKGSIWLLELKMVRSWWRATFKLSRGRPMDLIDSPCRQMGLATQLECDRLHHYNRTMTSKPETLSVGPMCLRSGGKNGLHELRRTYLPTKHFGRHLHFRWRLAALISELIRFIGRRARTSFHKQDRHQQSRKDDQHDPQLAWL